MATANKEQTASGETPAEFEITLDEFCTRQSRSDNRVELIGAFHHEEIAAGRVKDTESAYAKRYVAFANKPV